MLHQRSKETVRKEASAQVEARECHVLERFRAGLPIVPSLSGQPPPPFGSGTLDVVFKKQGDKLPVELQKPMQEPKQIQTYPCCVGCAMF